MVDQDAVHPHPEIAERLSKIYGMHTLDMDFRLLRPEHKALLEGLGNPHLKLPPIIHVAGTNGKGSTCAMLRAIYEAADYRVHMYTSPHLIKFNERIILAGEEISDEYLLSLLKETEKANNDREVTFKEFTCSLAMKAMAEIPADICLLEVGLGGRLDCTNVTPSVALSVITSIGYDHMAILGDSIEKIAYEKAGIIKKNGAVVIAQQDYSQALDTIKDIALEQNAQCYEADRSLSDGYKTNMVGDYQITNMATAVKVVNVLNDNFKVDEESLRQGLENVVWPGRMQNISDHFDLKKDQEIWLDCAHNKDGALSISKQLDAWKKQNQRPIYVVAGLKSSKQASDFFDPIKPYLEGVWCIDNCFTSDFRTGEELSKSLDFQTRYTKDYKMAVSEILDEQKNGCRILILGSVFIAGDVLSNMS